MKKLLALAVIAANPAFAATGPFFSLRNTDFIVTISFLLFVGIVVYFKVPQLIAKLLDQRADGIRADLDEARRLREEAQEIYASYERRQREVKTQAEDIIANARREALAQADRARADLNRSIELRIKGAEDQITTAENDAVRAVRDRAVQTAIAAASAVLLEQGNASDQSAGIDAAIDDVATLLH